jgi:hypothetical protein
MNDSSVVKIKQMRRQIMTHLNIFYPAGMKLDWLYRTVTPLDETYDNGLFVKDIAYLKGKGYIRFADEPLGGSTFLAHVAILTEAGKDIADRTATDPTLNI